MGCQDRIEALREQYTFVDGWAKAFETISPEERQPRLGSPRRLNHFCIGSDPEFSLVDELGRRVEAYPMGVMVGTAVGADQNERLVELRPTPSTSVVEHVASILAELRWFYRTHEIAGRCAWRSGAYFGDDGVGGHIHFGRKSSLRQDEIAALNALTICMARAEMFPLDEWNRRILGDRRGQVYGRLGDTRLQRHGFEYRTLPSWLNTPEQAFTVLTLSKLALLDPTLVIPWTKDVLHAREHFLLLAKYYKGRDDDALILYKLLQERWAKCASPVVADFRPEWGIPTVRNHALEYLILPTCIAPRSEEIEEVHCYLTEPGRDLRYRAVAATFKGRVPEGYIWLPQIMPPQRQAGVGDFIHDLVIGAGTQASFFFQSEADFIDVSLFFEDVWNDEEKAAFKAAGGVFNPGLRGAQIGVPKSSRRVPDITRAKKLLLSGLFPVWQVETVEPDAEKKWKEAHPKRKKEKIVDRKARAL